MDTQQGQEWLDLSKEDFIKKYSLEVWEDYEILHFVCTHPSEEEELLKY